MTAREILDALESRAEQMGITPAVLWSPSRKREVTQMRTIVVGEFLHRTRLSERDASAFIPRDRTDLYYLRQSYRDRWDFDKPFHHLVLQFREGLNENYIIPQDTSTIMFKATISGNVGRDAEVKDFGGKNYIGINVAVNNGKNAAPSWVKVYQYGGNQPDKFAEILRKGTGVVCTGNLKIGDYNGKPDITLWADAVEITKYADKQGDTNPYDTASHDDLPFD